MRDPSAYDRCDLCGSAEAEVLVHLRTGRALRSDRVLVGCDLRKVRCAACGLVRSGSPADEAHPVDLYESEYAVAASDYAFYTPSGPVRRVEAFCEWMLGAFGRHRWARAKRVLEVGAGAGALLAEFARRFPGVRCQGVELSRRSVLQAQADGIDVRHGRARDAEAEAFDVVYSVAVLEHVPSPAEFLADLRRRLVPGGLLYLCQPTQDVPSYDVFFTDHLHHFATPHLRGYARKCGFRELGFVVGHEWMPNFSLHLWQAADPDPGPVWPGPPAGSAVGAAVRRFTGSMQRLDRTLADLSAAGRRVGVFGLNEVYALARAYSDLGRFPIHCGLADQPDDPAHGRPGFPVVAPEACPGHGVQDVILAVNVVYYPQLRRRLEPLGVRLHPVLS